MTARAGTQGAGAVAGRAARRGGFLRGGRAAAARAVRRGALGLMLLLPAAAPANALTLFGLVDSGELYASVDGGASWTIRSTLPVRDAVALVAGSSSSQLFLATRTGSFYRSADAGLGWTAVSAIPAPDVAALVSYPGRLMLLSASGGVYTSTDDGSSWSAVGTITASDVVSALRTGSQYLALTRTGSVYRSLDNGATWGAVGALPASDAVEIERLGGNLYALTATGDVARSGDLGASWSFIGTLSQSGMTGLLSAGKELIATTSAGECAASASGMTWTWRGAIGQLDVTAIASDVPTTTGVGPAAPSSFRFARPWPNPASTVAMLALDLWEPARVTLGVYDAAGRLVARPIADELLPAGPNTRAWRPAGLVAGTYLVRARVGGRDETQRLVWLGGR